MVTAFRRLYYGVHGLALCLPLLYSTAPLHGLPLPSLLTIGAALLLLTLPRLLCINSFLHRGVAHAAYDVADSCSSISASSSFACHLLSSLSFLPYSTSTWAARHLHYHTLSPISPASRPSADPSPSAPAQGGADEDEDEEDVLGLKAPLPSLPRAFLALWSLWLREDVFAQQQLLSGEVTQKDDGSDGLALLHRYPSAPATAFVCASALLLSSLLSFPSSPALSALLVASLLSVSQVYLWLSTAVLLDHALAFPFVGYQLHRNPHHNSLLVALATAGGGYLNAHHAALERPFHTRLPFEFDPNSALLHLLSLLGVIRLPSSSPPAPALLPFESQLMTGMVSHTRMWPFYNRFVYPVSFVRTTLSADAGACMDAYWLFSARPQRRWWEGSPAIARLRPQQYLSRRNVLQRLQDAGQSLPSDPADRGRLRVDLVTCWRYLGYAMNPISYYLCYDGAQLLGMVSEVHNTPWDEVCWYPHPGRMDGRWYVDVQDKAMHVSPFMSMSYQYRLRYTAPADTWTVHWTMQHTHNNKHAPHHSTVQTLALSKRHPLHNPPPVERAEEKEGEGEGEGEEGVVEGRHFKAFLELQCRDVTQARLLQNCVQYPLQSMRVVWGIYYEAAVLFLRKHAAYYVHPAQLPKHCPM